MEEILKAFWGWDGNLGGRCSGSPFSLEPPRRLRCPYYVFAPQQRKSDRYGCNSVHGCCSDRNLSSPLTLSAQRSPQPRRRLDSWQPSLRSARSSACFLIGILRRFLSVQVTVLQSERKPAAVRFAPKLSPCIEGPKRVGRHWTHSQCAPTSTKYMKRSKPEYK
jgi:hypothetical protein